MRQCQSDACRFRFPAPAGTNEGLQCPECGALTAFVGQSFAAPSPRADWSPQSSPDSAAPIVEALLDNIRSVFNVGAMFRTADGAGLHHLHLCGITATPRHPKVAKTALGAEQATPWTRYRNALDAAQRLQGQGAQLWALERQEGSQSLFSAAPREADGPLVLVVGNERAGIDPQLLARCDRILHIPMAGMKESLNVAIAFGVAAYYLRHA